MDPMLEEYRRVASQIEFRVPQTPFVSCVLGREAREEVATPDYWISQVRGTVQFVQAIEAVDRLGARVYLEAGPHPVLVTLGQQCLAPQMPRAWLPSLRRNAVDQEVLLGSLGQLFTHRAAIDWPRLHPPGAVDRVSLPHYPFEGESYWIPQLPSGVQAVPGATAAVPVGIYQVEWEELPTLPPGGGDPQLEREVVIVGPPATAEGLARQLMQQLRSRGRTCRWVPLPADELPDSAWDALWPAAPAELDVISLAGNVQWGDASDITLVTQALRLVQSLARRGAARLWFVTLEAGYNPACGALGGFARTAALEFPDLWRGLIDLSHDEFDESRKDASRLLSMLSQTQTEDQLAWMGQICAPRLVPLPVCESPQLFQASPNGSYLVTGGTGALGLRMAQWLVERGARTLCLVSRRGAVAEAARQQIAQLERQGATILIEQVDVAQGREVRDLLARLRRLGPLHGVVHAAGVDLNQPISQTDPHSVAEVLAPKLGAAIELYRETLQDPLDLFLLFSSVSATFGSPGRALYAAANAGLDTLACRAGRKGDLSIAWGPWMGGGMASAEDLRELEQFGQYGIDPERALAAVDQLLAAEVRQATVVAIDWERFVPLYQSRRPRSLVKSLANSRAPLRAMPVSSGSAHSSPGGPQAGWLARLAGEPVESRQTLLTKLLRHEASDVLGAKAGRGFRDDQTFFEQGMDSLLATQFANRLGKHLGVQEPALVFQYPRLSELAPALLERLPIPAAGGSPTASPNGVSASPGSPWVAELTRLANDHRGPRLRELLKQTVASTLGLKSPGDVDPRKTLIEQGLDSLLATRFAARLQENLGACQPALVFQYPAIDQLTEHLLQTLHLPESPPSPLRLTAGGEQSAVERVPVAAPKTTIQPYDSRWDAAVWKFLAREYPNRDPRLLESRWKWAYQQSAARLALSPGVWLATDGDQVVAHHALIRTRLQVGSQQVSTGYFVDTMVSASHRDQALGPQLLLRGDLDQPFGLSLGQGETMREIMLQLGWRIVAPLQRAQLLLRPTAVLQGKLPPGVQQVAGALLGGLQFVRWRLQSPTRWSAAGATPEVREVDRFGVRHDRLWERVAPNFGCAVVRNASFLNWKWVDQPGQQFTRLELRRGEECLGIAVLTLREATLVYRYRRAMLTDLVVPLDQPEVMRFLLGAVVEAARRLEADSLECPHIHAGLTRPLQSLGFRLREPERFLMVHLPEDCDSQMSSRLLAADQWFITQADSDIDRPSAENTPKSSGR
jgi:NAD(P)-dependent dehydrogenase (short-subunit alcohol dehydrogenase family)/aryl carrier-like protein